MRYRLRTPMILLAVGLPIALMLVWLVSPFLWIGINAWEHSNGNSLWLRGGNLCLLYYPDSIDLPNRPTFVLPDLRTIELESFTGSFRFIPAGREGYWYLQIPLLAILSILIAASLAIMHRLRFPLWAWFALTAILGAELALYSQIRPID